jgi:spore coat polysaccharide biosynthesis predicted glycosyltransferase SpsG
VFDRSPSKGPRILFRVAAGPRLGSGHLVRALRLATAAGVPARVSIRGTSAHRLRIPARMRPIDGKFGPDAALDHVQPTLLVVDDPSNTHAEAWAGAARARGCPVIGIADAGIGLRRADIVVDGSVVARPAVFDVGTRVVRGCSMAMVDPAVVAARRREIRAQQPTVFVALGGGYRTAYARRVALAVRRRCDARIVVAGGFVRVPRALRDGKAVRWIGPQRSLIPWLAAATVAVVAGGITLYEACAIGMPTVALALVAPQRAAVCALATRGAVDAVSRERAVLPEADRVADRVVALLNDPARRAQLARNAQRTVDGRGTQRVARLLERIARGWPVDLAAARLMRTAA